MRSRQPHFIALVLLLAVALGMLPGFGVQAEEGMFPPDAVAKLNWADMAKRGMKLKPTDIFNPNGASFADAIVRVEIGTGGFGTGEFVSPNGLLLTNHHVGFDALVAASTPGKNYGEDGYKANSQAEELPAKNYAVRLTTEIKDVTSEILSVVTNTMDASQRNQAIARKAQEIEAADPDSQKSGEGIEINVERMTEGLYYYKFKYKVFPDVRIVYAPPKNIGFFGGDIDNFQWPRHCGDFTFMRVYATPDGKPAPYAASNVPYHPKKFMSFSMGGVKDNDFVFVMGYPGGTRRYRESYSVNYNLSYSFPHLVDNYSTQISVLQNIAKYDPAKKVKLQGTIFDLSNSLINWQGSILAMRRANIVQRKRDEEVEFTKWLDADPKRKEKYGQALPSIAKAYDELLKTEGFSDVVSNLYNTGLLPFIPIAVANSAEKQKPAAEQNVQLLLQIAQIRAQLAPAVAQRNPILEREMFKFYFRKAAELPEAQKIPSIESRFGKLTGDARLQAEEALARAIVDSKFFSSAAEAEKLFEMTPDQLKALNDPVISFALELDADNDKAEAAQATFNQSIQRWRPLFYEGWREMHGINYPDANASLRFTYGRVKGYIPREAASYQAFTYLFGVVEKDTGAEPFDVPQKLQQLYRTRDFGAYADPIKKDVPVDFISTTDIIGGNSGSPIMNGNGEQVGIVFDGNYEGLGNDFFYDEERGRTISVDIRYVLFVTDKFGGASYIFKELDIRNAPASLRKAA
ncbi:MAG TPA: S46 family peptidase [Pyrinomonadaceae bacterium]|nr:S46 family peptidase [Pyrinomonadaceae bacterium]